MRLPLFTLALIPLFLISACTAPPEVTRITNALPEDVEIVDCTPGQYGGIFVLAQSQPPKTFNPLIIEDAYSAQATAMLMSALTTFDPITEKTVPALAKSWNISKDSLTYTFELREGVHWSDGHDFTADDVIFTFDALFDERFPNRLKHQYTLKGKPITYRKIDSHTVEFKTPKKYAPFLNDIGFAEILPKHKLYPAFQNGTLLKVWSLDDAIERPKNIVGLGPFRIRQFLTGERLILEPNPHYWRADKEGTRLPYINFLIHQYVPDVNTQMVLFSTCQTDAADSISARDLTWIQKGATTYDFKIYDRGPNTSIAFLWFNMRPGTNEKGEYFVPPHKLAWFTDKRFRQAIMHGIDREGIIKSAALGKGTPLHSIISPASQKWYNPNVKKYAYSPKRAEALLHEMGFKKGPEGIFVDQKNRPLEFEFLASEGSEYLTNIVTAFKENMETIGVRVKLMFMDFASLIEKTNTTFNYESSIMGLTGGGDPSGGKAIYRSDGRLHVWNPEQKEPASAWEKKIDTLFDRQEQEMDETKRITLIQDMQSIFSEELPLIFMINTTAFTGVKNRWNNLKIHPLGALWNIDELWVDPLKYPHG